MGQNPRLDRKGSKTASGVVSYGTAIGKGLSERIRSLTASQERTLRESSSSIGEHPMILFSVTEAIEKLDRLRITMPVARFDGSDSLAGGVAVHGPMNQVDQTQVHDHSHHVHEGDALKSLSALKDLQTSTIQQRKGETPLSRGPSGSRRVPLPWMAVKNCPSSQSLSAPTVAEETRLASKREDTPASMSVDVGGGQPMHAGRGSPTESYASALSLPSSETTAVPDRPLHEKSSQNTITPAATHQSHHHLLAANQYQFQSGHTAEPVLTPGLKETGSFVGHPATVVLDVQSAAGSLSSKDSMVRKADSVPTASTTGNTTKVVDPTMNASPTEIADLLARLPPLREVASESSVVTNTAGKPRNRESERFAVDDKPENLQQKPDSSSSTPSTERDRHTAARSRALSLTSVGSNDKRLGKNASSASPKSHHATLRDELQGRYYSPSMLSVSNSDSTNRTTNVKSRPKMHTSPSMESRVQWIRSFFHEHPSLLDASLTSRPSQIRESPGKQSKKINMPTVAEITAWMEREAKARKNDSESPVPYTDQRHAESMTQVIYELEGLLRQALTMAQEAADKRESAEARARGLESQVYKSQKTTSSPSTRAGTVQTTKLPTYLNYHPDEPISGALETWRTPRREAQDVHAEASSPGIQSTEMFSKASPVLPQGKGQVLEKDWTSVARKRSTFKQPLRPAPLAPREPKPSRMPTQEKTNFVSREAKATPDVASREDVRQHIQAHHEPPIQPRLSSLKMRNLQDALKQPQHVDVEKQDSSDSDPFTDPEKPEFLPPRPGYRQSTAVPVRQSSSQVQDFGYGKENDDKVSGRHSHFIVRDHHHFSLSRSHRRAPIARNWSEGKKRWVATVTCLNTMLLGLVIGIYAGEVPAIQYTIVDENHYAILGNVVLFLGLAISTALFWPLPILHGRKPYTLGALVMLLALQFPQAMVVSRQRSPYVASYRAGLLIPRAFTGFFLGFASINFKTTLLDLFGASLQSSNPHQEVVDDNDVRRNGGGMGLWLGFWTWSFIGSIGVGFLIGAAIINDMTVSWGFWITIILTAVMLLLNVLVPEVRRSAYRRSVTEVRNGEEVSHRVARGEIKMHLDATGPVVWYEEVLAGYRLMAKMLMQPGFTMLALYTGWIYGQIIMVIVLLGALLSRYYRFHSQYVGLCVFAISIGALLAIPFQKASLLSRSRTQRPRTDSMTFEKRVTWSSHLVRRSIFMFILPFAGLAYTLSSGGPKTTWFLPTFFAGVIGFLSCLAISECNGLIMETYDTSDLQPGMTGRPRPVLPEELKKKQTNYSCYPRISAGFAITQTFSYLIAAAATGTGGAIERRLGAQAATGVVAGILLILTLFLIVALTRWKPVQIVPSQRYGTNILSGATNAWKPVIIGHPSGTTRRLSLLEMGKMSRWTEIRKRNRLATGFTEEMEMGALASKT